MDMSIPGGENSKCKGPEAERAWHDLRTDTEPVALEHREAGGPRAHRTLNARISFEVCKAGE